MKDQTARLEWEVSRIHKIYSERKKLFQSMVRMALGLERVSPHGLKGLIRLLGLKKQTEFLTYPMLYKSYESIPYNPYEEWFSVWCGDKDCSFALTPDGKDFYDLAKPIRQTRTISLSQDLVLSSDQFQRAVSSSPRMDFWTQRNGVPQGWLWEPVNIAMIEDRDGAIQLGILQGVGAIEVHNVYDISAVYDFVYCDGENFIRSWDGKVVAPVYDPAFAAIFEIGRMILKQKKG